MTTHLAKADFQTVVNCYSLFDKFFPICGMLDYTEGIYHDNPSTSYDKAQQDQIGYVLDEVKCRKDVRVLDVGCGNGTLLEEVRRRGAKGIGITISPEQVALCRQKGLDVQLLDYKEIGEEWNAQFDAVVANGPVEHFVQAKEAAEGKADTIYSQMFRTFQRVINPASPVRRLINTTIHFVRRPEPEDLLRSPLAFRPLSDNFHYALLARSFGGYYPVEGQFERCAEGCFELTKTVDGTYDYHLTSEEWLRRIRRALRTVMGLRILAKSLPVMARQPKQCVTMLLCMLVSQSWNWQFRTANPPTKLLRQTWEYRPVGGYPSRTRTFNGTLNTGELSDVATCS
jgi:cyclopropane fatty-acyl-phospholipid synthase-like methyltransferase